MTEAVRSRTYPLRLAPSMRSDLEILAKSEGISVNHLISIAVAEKLSRMEQKLWRAAPAERPKNLAPFRATGT